MDVHKALELSKLADQMIKLANQYEHARSEAGEAKANLDILLVPQLEIIRSKKKNAGYDVSILMLLELKPEAREIYETYVKTTASYKGLEKLIEAIKSKISLEQSILKYIGEGEKFG